MTTATFVYLRRDRGRCCSACQVGWVGTYGDTCWCCGQPGVDGWVTTRDHCATLAERAGIPTLRITDDA